MKVRPAYGVSEGPEMVAVQASRLLGLSGNAEIPGVVDNMSCMSSVCRLEEVLVGCVARWARLERISYTVW